MKIPSKEEVQKIIAEQESKINAQFQELSKEPGLAQFSTRGNSDGAIFTCTACKQGLIMALGPQIAIIAALVVPGNSAGSIRLLASNGIVIGLAVAVGTDATSLATLFVAAAGAGLGVEKVAEDVIDKLCKTSGFCI